MDVVAFARTFLGTYGPADIQTDAGGYFVLVAHSLGHDFPLVFIFVDGGQAMLASNVEHIDQMSCKVYCPFTTSLAARVVA